MRSWCSFFIRGSVPGYGSAVAQAYGISLLRQLALLIILRIRYGTSADDFYRYRLYLKTSNEASGFLALSSHIKRREQLYRKLSIAKEPLTDKRSFYRRCHAVGLPVPETVAEFTGGAFGGGPRGNYPGVICLRKKEPHFVAPVPPAGILPGIINGREPMGGFSMK